MESGSRQKTSCSSGGIFSSVRTSCGVYSAETSSSSFLVGCASTTRATFGFFVFFFFFVTTGSLFLLVLESKLALSALSAACFCFLGGDFPFVDWLRLEEAWLTVGSESVSGQVSVYFCPHYPFGGSLFWSLTFFFFLGTAGGSVGESLPLESFSSFCVSPPCPGPSPSEESSSSGFRVLFKPFKQAFGFSGHSGSE